MWPILGLFTLGAVYAVWYVGRALSRGRIPGNPTWRDGAPTRADMPVAYWTCVAPATFVAIGLMFAVVKVLSWEW